MANKVTILSERTADHSNHPNWRMRKGGDLYLRPLSREEMLAPMNWAEKQMAVCYRYGILSDGTVGYAKIQEP